MKPEELAKQEATFNQLTTALLAELKADEQLTIELSGEHSQFVRFNTARVRQTGDITDGQVQLTLMHNQRSSFREFPFVGNWEIDWPEAQAALADLRQEVPQLPSDPYLVLPTGNASSRDVYSGQLLAPEAVAAAVLTDVSGLDFTGIYGGGASIRAYADSAGQRHWFATETFALDYSLFATDGQAVKGTFAGSHWDQSAYGAKLADSKLQLERLATSPKFIPKGQYRTYLAPAAIAELVSMFSWGGVSEAALQQGSSALGLLQRGEKLLSPHFSLTENFGRGLVPRFNELGEVAPLKLPLIADRKLVNTLVSSRTAKEYSKTANGANSSESLRSPDLSPGTLAAAEILNALDTGLYLSNLHYLNWSDRPTGRVTGMTRYACFWVENGEIVAPIENLRFDETIYRCFGDNLLLLTDFQEFIPEVGTYSQRNLGGMWMPGAIVADFTYTL
ncbi:TldD/PmbA family protein [Oculatella sp. LEGE 06141]|uniref:TldD/PmbA family protein n=1 Tax=Oculatella sp. LEGE 06141 TaxID=1828648 RepID=UPI00187EF58C|nr:TldD/PmbA family protein [Oculatella sp. LEGE 06141]MBE9181724.1 TldD/PmbA family protein [Oculatella sp. LEGE 06141]